MIRPATFFGGLLLLGSALSVSAQSSALSAGWNEGFSGAPEVRLRTPDSTAGLPTASLGSGFGIDFVFSGGLTGSQQNVFTQAKGIWETYLVGYQGGISLNGVEITAEGKTMDGVGGALGSAGPTYIAIQGGFLLATDGIMSFDSADLADMEADGSLLFVITHEIGHVLGFGTLWDGPGLGFSGTQQVSVDGTGRYTGAGGLAAWRTEFGQPGANFVPVELGGGAGTANAHWNENDNGGGLTGITDTSGNDLANELMTGWISNPDDVFISQTTIASFSDLGFEVDLSGTLAPEPAPLVLLALGVLLPGLRRSRKTS